MLDQDFLDKFGELLDKWNGRISCTRWGSSVAHQLNVNPAAPKSWHTLWRAIDLTTDNPSDLPQLASDALAIGFTGVELDLKNNHVHVDNRSTTVWHVVSHADGSTEPLDGYLPAKV